MATYSPRTICILKLVFLISLLLQQCLADENYGDEEMKRKIQESAKEHGLDPSTSQIMMPPDVDDEERGSRHMPSKLRCSGCWAVAYQFDLAFKKALKSVKSGSRLPLADQIDVSENVCEKALRSYGLKQVQGKKLLSGPGLGADSFPGVMEAGGKWEARLNTLCLEIVEEYEEEGIYDGWSEDRDHKSLANEICVSYCHGRDESEGLNDKDESTKKTEL